MRGFGQHHGLRGRAGHDQRAVAHGVVQVADLPGLQAHGLCLRHKSLRAGAAARMYPDLARAQPCGKSLQVGAALNPCANDEQRALRLGRQPARSQQGNRRSAPRCDGGAIQNQLALAGGHVKHDDIALNGGAAAARVARRETDELGHGQLAVRRRHAEQAAIFAHGHDDTWRN